MSDGTLRDLPFRKHTFTDTAAVPPALAPSGNAGLTDTGTKTGSSGPKS